MSFHTAPSRRQLHKHVSRLPSSCFAIWLCGQPKPLVLLQAVGLLASLHLCPLSVSNFFCSCASDTSWCKEGGRNVSRRRGENWFTSDHRITAWGADLLSQRDLSSAEDQLFRGDSGELSLITIAAVLAFT